MILQHSWSELPLKSMYILQKSQNRFPLKKEMKRKEAIITRRGPLDIQKLKPDRDSRKEKVNCMVSFCWKVIGIIYSCSRTTHICGYRHQFSRKGKLYRNIGMFSSSNCLSWNIFTLISFLIESYYSNVIVDLMARSMKKFLFWKSQPGPRTFYQNH